MVITIEAIAPYVGQPIYDVYGRKVGILVGFSSEVDGTVTAVEILKNDREYETIPPERIEVTTDGIRILPLWLINARAIERRFDHVKKRLRALEELHRKNQIPRYAYDEIKAKLMKEYEKVREDAKKLKEELKKVISEIDSFVAHLEKVMTSLMVTYTAGEISEQGFKVSMDHLKFAKQTALDEKHDIERHIMIIERLEHETVTKPEEVVERQPQPVEETVSAVESSEPIVVRVVGEEQS